MNFYKHQLTQVQINIQEKRSRSSVQQRKEAEKKKQKFIFQLDGNKQHDPLRSRGWAGGRIRVGGGGGLHSAFVCIWQINTAAFMWTSRERMTQKDSQRFISDNSFSPSLPLLFLQQRGCGLLPVGKRKRAEISFLMQSLRVGVMRPHLRHMGLATWNMHVNPYVESLFPMNILLGSHI